MIRVQTRNDRTSPWGKRLVFTDEEFELMMDELRFRAGDDHFASGTGVDVDRVLLAVGIEADYVDLPPGVLGRTRFGQDGAPSIELSRELADNAETSIVARRRLRTTLAHECGHFACHTSLFIRDTSSLSLFGDQQLDQRQVEPILCRTQPARSGYSGEWWEYQANRCMAALLMPRRLFGPFVIETTKTAGYASFMDAVAAGAGEEIATAVADEFDVNLAAVLYRLQDLGFVTDGKQRTLVLE